MTASRLHLLFVCSKNQWRSPTAEMIYRRDPRVRVRSAGTSASAKKCLSLKNIQWADFILVMENKHKKIILARYRDLDLPTIEVLDIPDEYQYMDEELIAILRSHTEDLIARQNNYYSRPN